MYVAPFAGAWIEIIPIEYMREAYYVAPFAGAWIEIKNDFGTSVLNYKSHPSRVRGLKLSYDNVMEDIDTSVAPFAGAWIEMSVV